MKKLKLLLIIPLIFLMFTGCTKEQSKDYLEEYNQALKEHQEKNLPVLTKEELQAIEKDISDKIFNDTEGKYKDIEVISIEVDEKNNLVDVCLKENTKENQKKFKEKVNNSEYIIFTSKRDPHVEAN